MYISYELFCFISARRPGDSGQGESDSEHDTSSSDTDNDLVSHELIKWKKGRLIGKGAFGKVAMGCIWVANVSCDIGMGGADGFSKADCSEGSGA